jgi:hypothetical protein
LLLGAYSALERQVGMGKIHMYSRHEMLDVVTIEGKARGIIARNLITGEIERYFVPCSGLVYRRVWQRVLPFPPMLWEAM